jgi:rhodanese-related sulfurtransferase
MSDKQLAKEILILFALSLGLAFLVNHFSPVGIALVGQWDTRRGVISAKAKKDIIVDSLEIKDVAVAKQIHDRGNALFLDARPDDDYARGHIPGAISLPIDRFDAQIGNILDRHPENRPIVTYCSGRTCEDSHKLARLLIEFGFTDVKIFIDGFPGWEKKGYPVEQYN